MKTSNVRAFPQPVRPNMPTYIGDLGLTKREYAAIKAMQGILASIRGTEFLDADQVAMKSLEYANKILKQLQKP